MKNIKMIYFLSLVICFYSISGFAKLDVPKLTGRVVDKANILSSYQKDNVEGYIRRLESATNGGQMAVLIIPSLNGEVLEQFSIKVADKWKIGQKDRDSGAILLVSIKDRKIRLEIGNGWEGPVNDARAGDIIRGMGPYFRNSEYDKGIIYAVNQVSEFVSGKKAAVSAPAPRRTTRSSSKSRSSGDGWFFWVIVIIIVIVSICSKGNSSGGGRSYRGRRRGGYWGSSSSGGGFFGGGGFSSGGRSGGGFSGGGGGFSGGGASGGW